MDGDLDGCRWQQSWKRGKGDRGHLWLCLRMRENQSHEKHLSLHLAAKRKKRLKQATHLEALRMFISEGLMPIRWSAMASYHTP